MQVAIVYDSRTGNTKSAAYAMGQRFEEQGHAVRVQSVADADPAEVARADLICVGCWTRGLFVILQKPTRAAMLFIAAVGRTGPPRGGDTQPGRACPERSRRGADFRLMSRYEKAWQTAFKRESR